MWNGSVEVMLDPDEVELVYVCWFRGFWGLVVDPSLLPSKSPDVVCLPVGLQPLVPPKLTDHYGVVP